VDRWLRDCRPRFVLSRGVIAEGRMLTLPIVEDLDVFEDVLLGFVSGDILSLMYQLTLERSEETFDARVVPAVAFTAHARNEAVLSESVLVAQRGILGGFNWLTQHWVVRQLVGMCLGLQLVSSNQASSAVWC